jgi:micrococcal nuclease
MWSFFAKFSDKVLIKIIILMISFLFFGCQVTEKQSDRTILSAQLVRVVSGQTIEVVISQQNHRSQQVRLIGIDVPKETERVENRLKKMLADRNINLELESNERDRYNRLFAHVWHNDTLVSEKLAQEGLAIANTRYPHQYSDRIFHAQEYARILGYGIWAKRTEKVGNS